MCCVPGDPLYHSQLMSSEGALAQELLILLLPMNDWHQNMTNLSSSLIKLSLKTSRECAVIHRNTS